MLPVVILLSSCRGMTYISTPQTVALSQGNFKFVKSVKAETKAWYVFGIGGFRERAKEDVIEKLRVNADLQPYQALADIRVKTTNNGFRCFIWKRTLTAAATVVEFKDSDTNAFSKVESPSDLTMEFSRESIYNRLLEIKEVLVNGNNDSLEKQDKIKRDVWRAREWYDSIHDIYPEIHNILKEIKSLL